METTSGNKRTTREVNLGGKIYKLEFIIADVSRTLIIGSDFMMHFCFSVDYLNKRLTYHPDAPEQSHTPFCGYHMVNWDKVEVNMVQLEPWMQTAVQPTYFLTKM